MLLELSNRFRVCSFVVFLCLATASVAAAAEEPESSSDEKPKTLKVTGVFESLDAAEIKADNEHFAALKIERIVPHGTKVTKGQNVVWFDPEEIDKKIKDAEIDLRLAKLTSDDEEFAYKQFLEAQALDRTAADLARKNAQQNFDNFVQVDRDRQRLNAEFDLKSSVASLENAAEELKQLEQMYKEDDLTEESEEIVLKRAKQSVEFAEFRLKGTKINTDRAIKQAIPRTQAQQDDALARALLTHQKAIRDLNSAKQKQDIEMARKRDKFKDEEKKVAEMRAERKKIVLQSPRDGILVHGTLTRGKLGEKPSALKEGATVTGQQVIATVVGTERLQVRLDVQEDQLKTITAGAKCTVTPKAFPDQTLSGVVKSVSAVPYAGSKYDGVVTFKQPKNGPAILPTMTCDVEFELPKEEKADEKADGAKKNGKEKQ